MISFKGELKDIVRTIDNKCILTITTNTNNLPMDELSLLKCNEKGIKVDISKYHKQRSLNANAYFHLLVNEIAKKVGVSDTEIKVKMNLEYGTPAIDKAGNKVTIKLPADVDISKFYDYAKWIGEKTENGLKLNYYVFYKQTHTLNTEEMSRLIQGTVDTAKELGIQVYDDLELKKIIDKWEVEYEKQKK